MAHRLLISIVKKTSCHCESFLEQNWISSVTIKSKGVDCYIRCNLVSEISLLVFSKRNKKEIEAAHVGEKSGNRSYQITLKGENTNEKIQRNQVKNNDKNKKSK